MTAAPASRHYLPVEPLRAAAFQPFGDVIAVDSAARHFTINAGYAERYHDLATVDVAAHGGRPLLSIFRAQPRALPLPLQMLERHPLGSQAFFPLMSLPYLVVVAPPGPQPEMPKLRCFLAQPGQGVNYARGTWHHPLLALHAECDFLVVDRGGMPGDANCDEFSMGDLALWIGDLA